MFQFFVRLDHIRKCFTQKGGIFILEEFSKCVTSLFHNFNQYPLIRPFVLPKPWQRKQFAVILYRNSFSTSKDYQSLVLVDQNIRNKLKQQHDTFISISYNVQQIKIIRNT